MDKVFWIAVIWMSMILSCSEPTCPLDQMVIKTTKLIVFDEATECTGSLIQGKNSMPFEGEITAIGGISRRYEKKSYLLTSDAKIPILNLKSAQRLILNASYIDKTLMRHRLCFDLFRTMDESNKAPETMFLTLSLNDDYRGIYVGMEFINEEYLDLDPSDPNAHFFGEPDVFREEYLNIRNEKLEFDLLSGSESIEDILDQLHQFIVSSDDELFQTEIEKWIDLKNFIDWHLLLLFTNNSDGILKNFALYKKNALEPFRVAIWDYDHSFGRDGDNELNLLDRNVDIHRSVLFRRLMNLPNFGYESRLRHRYHELRQEETFSRLIVDDFIQKYSTELEVCVDSNFKRWPVDSKWYYDEAGFQEEVELIRKFTDMNLSRLDEQFQYNPG